MTKDDDIFYAWQGNNMPIEYRCEICAAPSYGYVRHMMLSDEKGKGFLCRPHYEERKEMIALAWLARA